MIIPVILLIIGIVGVWIGAYLIVESLQRVGKSMNLSDAFLGLTVLSIGTSLPEIFTHIVSSLDILKGIEASGIAVGTNVGSNIIQITLIVGLIGLLAKVKSDKKILFVDYPIMLGAILLLFLLSIDGKITRIEGAILVALYITYIVALSVNEKLIKKNPFKADYLKEAALITAGFILLLYCANIVVGKAIYISTALGIMGSFIGVLVIGVSTALPELTAAIVAIMKGSKGMSLGTLIGSNITNPLLALGIGAVISGYTIDNALRWFDIPFWFVVSLVAMGFFYKKMRLSKKEALALIGLYLVYVFIRIKWFM